MVKDRSSHFSFTMPDFVTQYSSEPEECLKWNNHNNDNGDILVPEIFWTSIKAYFMHQKSSLET